MSSGSAGGAWGRSVSPEALRPEGTVGGTSVASTSAALTGVHFPV